MIMATINIEKFIVLAKEQVEDNNLLNIVDLLRYFQSENLVEQVIDAEKLDELIEKELDDRCDNGHFSRWTSHGCSIWHEYEEARYYYY